MEDETPIYVLADDLTGAADAANYFRTSSHRVRVSFSAHQPWNTDYGPDVVQVFDSESRSVEEGVARQRLMSANQTLHQRHGSKLRVYKKIDSTMRGHVGAEIEAALQGLQRKFAVLAPSFPANQRMVKEGRLYVGGLPITQTPFAKDPKNPIVDDDVSRIVQKSTRLSIVTCHSANGLRELLETHPGDGTVVVVDASTEQDLQDVAEIIAYRDDVIPCGSAGLAKALAELWVGAVGEGEHTSQLSEKPTCTNVLVAVGSANPTSHEQLAVLREKLGAESIVLQPTRLADTSLREQETTRGKRELAQAKTSVVGVELATERASGEDFVKDLAEAASSWIMENTNIGLVATGGDTVLAICKTMGVDAVWPEGEVESGMPWSRIEVGGRTIPVVSKAGGFGNQDALLHAAQYLMGDEQQL